MRNTWTKKRLNSAFLAGLLSAGLLFSGCRSGNDVSKAGESSGAAENSDTVDLIVDGTMQAVILYDLDDASAMTAAYHINDILKSVTGLPLSDMKNVRGDTMVEENGGVEILVGKTNRAESSLTLDGRRSYGVGTKNNRVVIFGGPTEEGEKVTELFRQLAEQYYDGSSLRLPKDLWVQENCLPESASYESAYGSSMDYASGKTAEDFESHCRALEDDGCVPYQKRRTGDNHFVTYKKDGSYIHTYYTAYSGEIRTVFDRQTCVDYHTEPPTLEKVADTCVTQAIMSYDTDSFGMGYVVTLEDGSFLVIDGGYGMGDSETRGRDVTRLYNLLRAHNKRTDGKIVIAAWVLTHDHPDHTSVFHQFAQEYADRVTLEMLVLNAAGYTGSSYLSTGPALEDLKQFGKTIPVFVPHTGQQFFIRNAGFEVLYTQEDTFPETPNTLGDNFINESSLVMRMTAGGQTILWTADMEDIASGILCGMYGEGLKSDIVQMAHHGYTASATEDFYRLVDPAVVLWPAKNEWFQSWSTTVSANIYLLNDLHVQEVVVADDRVKNLTLPYAANGGTLLEEDIPGR